MISFQKNQYSIIPLFHYSISKLDFETREIPCFRLGASDAFDNSVQNNRLAMFENQELFLGNSIFLQGGCQSSGRLVQGFIC